MTFVTSTLVARGVGPSGSGTYALAVLLCTLAATIVSLGINSANIYFIAQKTHPQGTVIGSSLMYSTLVGTAAAFILLMNAPFLSRKLMNGAPVNYLYMSLPMIPVLLVSENIFYLFMAHRDMMKVGLIQLVRPVMYLGILATFSFAFHLTLSIILWGFAAGLLASMSAGIFLLWRNEFCKGLSVDRAFLKLALRFGVKQHLGSVSQLLNYRLDNLIIAAFLTNTQVGLYSLAVMMGETIWYIPNALGQILFIKTAASDSESANRVTPLVCRNTVLVSTLAAAILFFVAMPIVPWIFTAKFTPSVMALRLLLPGIVALSVSKVLGSDLTGRGYPQYSTYASLISVIVNVGANFLLIPRFGVNGAATAASFSYAANAAIILLLFRRTTGIQISDVIFFKKEDLQLYIRILSWKSTKGIS